MSTLEDRSLAELVSALPASARVMESFGLDYCCGGDQLLSVACERLGLDPGQVVAALREVPAVASPDWATMTPTQLVDHIESTHHAYLHTELGRLDLLAEKVASVHGARHPELMDVLADVRELRDDLEPHLLKEERVLFPLIREVQEAAASGRPVAVSAAPIAVMRREHDRAGVLLLQLRAHTRSFTVPGDASASFHALSEGLAHLEADTHLHVHKENNVLFPAVGALGG